MCLPSKTFRLRVLRKIRCFMRKYRSVHVVCAMEMPMQFNMYRFIICNGNAANAQCRYPCLCALVCKRNVMSWFRIVSSFCKYCTFVFHRPKLYWNANFVCLQWNLHFFSEIHSVLLFVQSVACFFFLCLCPGRFQGGLMVEDFRSPMVLAGLSGSVECLKLLLSQGMQIRQESLMLLSTAGCLWQKDIFFGRYLVASVGLPVCSERFDLCCQIASFHGTEACGCS